MRNLKRALSLTLASVMLLGMMVVGSSAAAGYSDVDDNDNVEAIEVLQAVEVMVGDDRGFGPDRPVTRNEMAVVMGKLLNLDYNYYVSTCPFTDVADWAKGWVGACAANGIVSGRGNGIYDGESTVTAIEAASMMMRALGYFKNIEDYADGFATVTVRQGSQIGIFNMVGTDATTAMTRNQVAQMALNALRSEVVDFTGTPAINANGISVAYRAEYTPRTSTEAKYNAIEGRTSDVASDLNHKGQYYIQLGEELYDGDLRLNDHATDDFGRPSRYWEYDGKAIGTYAKYELMRKDWTDEVTGKDLYDLLGSDTIKKYDFDITIDGVTVGEKTGTTENDKVLDENAESFFDQTFMTKTYKSKVGQTGKGVLTQVFVNPDTEEVDVAIINTYLAKAASDYNEKKDEAKLDVYGLDKTDGSEKDTVWFKEPEKCSKKDQDSKSISVAAEDFIIAEDIKKDDYFLVTEANGEIKTLVKPEIISAATLTEFSKDSYVINDGTKYSYNTTIEYDPDTLENYTGISATQQLKDTEYNLFLDAYGYLIGVEIVEAVNNYIFLTGIDQGTSNLKNKTSEAAGILTDGTFIEFKMNMNDSKAWGPNHLENKSGGNDGTELLAAGETVFTGHPLWNTWCTYTVDKDGVYTLKEVRDEINLTKTDAKPDIVKVAQTHDTDYMDKTIDHKHVSLKGGTGYTYVYGNDDTVYIVPELTAVATDTELEKDSVWVPKHTGTAPKDITAPTANKRGVKENVGIISGVDSVTVGIDNVDLRTWTLAEIQAEDGGKLANVDNVIPGNVYTLYDKDGYVIAAIVLGEDNGTTKNLVYSHKDDIESEKYNSADDEWTWTRYVIKDGDEILLTQTGDDVDKANSIYKMKENVWYEVSLKADGTVKKVEYAYYTESGAQHGTTPATGSTNPTGPALALNNGSNDKDFVADIANMEDAVEKNSTVLYEQDWQGLTKAPALEGSTLYVDTVTRKGFYVNPKNVKSVLIQTNNDKETTTYYDTIGELEDILDDLNVDKDKEYNFKISAIMTDGRATVVIIHDWNATHGEKGEKPETPTDNSKKVTLFAADGKLYVDKSITDTTEQAAAIRGWLDANGYSDVDVQIKAGNITAKGSKGGVTYTWSDDTDATIVDTKALVDIKVNGKDVTVHEDATVAQVTGVESDSNNYVLESKTDQAVLTTAKVVAGENYGTTGYVKYTTITVTAPSKWTAGAVTVTKVNKTERSGAAADFVAIGSKITCTLTSKGEVKFPSGDTVTVQYKLALTNGSFDVSKSTYKNWKVTDGAIETQVDETAALTGNVVYIGATDTIGVTYTVQSKTAVAATALNITETAGVSAP